MCEKDGTHLPQSNNIRKAHIFKTMSCCQYIAIRYKCPAANEVNFVIILKLDYTQSSLSNEKTI